MKEEERCIGSAPSSTVLWLKAVCVLVLTCAIETLTWAMLKRAVAVLELLLALVGLLQQLLWMVGCSVGEVGFCSCVVSFCLEIVLMLRWVCALEVVVCPACTLTTTSMLRLLGCVHVDDWLL